MKKILEIILIGLTLMITACNYKQDKATNAISESVFPKGEILKSNNFTGTVWLKMMGASDTSLHAAYGNVTFEPKARTNWHSHPGGQLLFITKGKGYYQAKGETARLLRAGDFVEIPPNIEHWHGAAPESEFAHIAISLNTNLGGAEWKSAVSETEYLNATK
ncbi:hypothetical protein BZG01_10380 [Labilibaculum manganireducens]|uniref:Cupin type-2 domain-containing protein n=1 Tax=Labilibaculum manganireducens TaxID=1940525 RepID=A0A2N3I8L2_9BACT|nr:cupin domain-containing protein [Labilibaculum manganireducens]PKQ66674.1 hypothetical protein BZG01_10380 [Labilibaculum manganireducens]